MTGVKPLFEPRAGAKPAALYNRCDPRDPLMTTETLKDARLAEETTPGNYFISNYPPYSFWTPDRVQEAFGALERAPAPRTPLGIYLHIPFCRKRCHFCYFKVYTDKHADEIEVISGRRDSRVVFVFEKAIYRRTQAEIYLFWRRNAILYIVEATDSRRRPDEAHFFPGTRPRKSPSNANPVRLPKASCK